MSQDASKNPPNKCNLQHIEGFPIPAAFSTECFISATKYKPHDGDVFIVTYPKCGTTWTHYILVLILRQGEPVRSASDFFNSAPFLEVTGGEAADKMPSPRAFKTHINFPLMPWSDKAKYIYVTRNPKDCCVSYYHHMKGMRTHTFDGTFDEFFEMFMSGEIDYGDYFDHLLGWYEHRNDPNVFFITYEELQENIEESILKMATFIDDKMYAEPLRNDREKLNNVIKYSSFKYMKEKVNKDMDEIFTMSKEEVQNSDLPSELKKMLMFSNPQGKTTPPKGSSSSNFVRKGIVGDWKNYLSEDQNRRLNEKFEERTKGTDIPNFWKKYM